jgi:hypothetical protein
MWKEQFQFFPEIPNNWKDAEPFRLFAKRMFEHLTINSALDDSVRDSIQVITNQAYQDAIEDSIQCLNDLKNV